MTLRSERFGADITRALREEVNAVHEKAVRANRMLGLALVREIKLTLSTPGRGETRRSAAGGRVMHRASAPGDPPAADLGVLRNSIDIEHDRSTGRTRVGTGVEYAPPLEYGTPRMAARPYMRPSVERLSRYVGRDLLLALKEGAGVGSAATGALRQAAIAARRAARVRRVK